jgi:exodeoxyribonuclease X
MDYSTWPRLLVVDVEGNGHQPPDLIELAVVPVENGRPVPACARATLVHPPRPITPFATRVHHITDQHVAGAPAWKEIAEQVKADLDGAWIAAHNAHVDYRVLARHLPDWTPTGVLDTLRLARATYPDADGHGLDALLAYTAVPLDEVPGQRHRAAYDAHATSLLLIKLADRYRTWDALVAAAVPPGMPGDPRSAALPQFEPEPEEPTLW